MLSCLSCLASPWCVGAAAVLFGVLYFLADHVPRLNVSGKHVLITGGSQGIGKELAKAMASKGAAVSIIARKQNVIAEALAEVKAAGAGAGSAGVRAFSRCADVGDRKQVDAAIAGCAADAGGAIDVLVCNAGYAYPALIEDQPADEFDKTMRVNYLGCVYAVRAALPHMSRGGRIVLVGSMAGLTGVAGYTSYCPTKFAVRGLAEALCMELRPRGISVSLVTPPDVDTPGFAHENLTKPPETKVVDSGVYSAAQVAGDIARAIERYQFLVTTGFDGWLLGTLASATAPVHSVWTALFHGVATGLLRVVLLGYQKYFAFRLQQIYDKKQKDKAAAGGGAGAAGAAAADRKSD